jgi:Fe-S-cluster containining protein
MSETEGKRSVRIELDTPDWSMRTTLGVPIAKMTLDDWLPFLQALGDHAYAVSEQAAQGAGKSISCTKGCAACCRELVAVSLVEARSLARLIAAMPEPRRSRIVTRFADAARRARASGLFEGQLPSECGGGAEANAEALEEMSAQYFQLGIPCPFLEDESCSIYRDRPLICREHLVTSPAAYCSGARRELVAKVPVNVHFTLSLSRATSKIAGIPDISVPLVFALNWAAVLEEPMSVAHDPISTLRTLLEEVGEARVIPDDPAIQPAQPPVV